MDWLKSLYPTVRDILYSVTPAYWPELRFLLERAFSASLIPEAILPLASCQAVGGEAKNAVHISAALVAAATSLRILDDLEDQDRAETLWQQVGPTQAWNYASALQTLSFEILNQAPLPAALFRQLNSAFIDTFLRIAYGQNRDILGQARTIEEYWLIVEQKIARGYATACAAGAMIGTEKTDLIQACNDFGFHLGFAIQILNDMEAIWYPNQITDLKQNKVTLPLLYGLSRVHPGRSELLSLIEEGNLASHEEQVKEILDSIDTPSFLIWAALQERDYALAAISICPDAQGREALESYVTGMFAEVEPLWTERLS